jgi:hypothetical protein
LKEHHQPLGKGGRMATTLAIASNSDDRLELFWLPRTSNCVFHSWQLTPAGRWAPPVPHGITLDPAILSDQSVALARNQDGRLEGFAGWQLDVDGTFGRLVHTWQQVAGDSESWTDWSFLGKGWWAGSNAVASNADGRLEFFGAYGDHDVHHIWQTAPNNGWSSFHTLGNGNVGNFGVGRNGDGRLEIFALTLNNSLQHCWQVSPNSGWSDWHNMGGTPDGLVQVAGNVDGNLEVFVRGKSGELLHIWQQGSAGWSTWQSLHGVWPNDAVPALLTATSGTLNVFVRGMDTQLYRNAHAFASPSWTGWQSLGGTWLLDPAVGQNSDGTIEVVYEGRDGNLYHNRELSTGGWAGWMRI